jgi:hypothetical protein
MFLDNPTEFNRVMLDVDNKLSLSGCSIPARPSMAIGEISKKFSIALPMGTHRRVSPQVPAESWSISERITEWYNQRYGERIKVDYSPGRMAILIENDLWILKIPFILGSVSFFVSRTIKSNKLSLNNKPATYNVLDAVVDLPPSRIPMLPDNELEHIFRKFLLGLKALSIVRSSIKKHELISSALADIEASIEHFTGSRPNYGLSKWASLQASEKLFKAAIALAGGNFTNTHSLEKLGEQAKTSGLTETWVVLLPYIQCSPGIRYGGEACDRDSAIFAHDAALNLVIKLKEGGAVFDDAFSL